MTDNPGRPLGMARDLITGIRYFGQGLVILVRRPRLAWLGMLPAVVTTAILLGAMISLIATIGDLTALVTPFADGWAAGWRDAVRVTAGIALIAGAVLLGLVGFTAVTLTIGGPFYEHIAERIEDDLGATAGHVRLPVWKMFTLGVRDSIMLMLHSLMFSVLLFIAGFIPVIGQTLVPVLVVLVTSWFLALEVVGVSFYRRGMGLKERTRMLRSRRMLVLGLGLPAALLSVIPLMTLVVTPVVFAGGVLVALDTLGQLPGGRPAAAVTAS
jgi:CysZ protein